jgi:putative transposase
MATLRAQIRLWPDPPQARALETTLRQANAAADTVSAVAWERSTFGRYALQRLAYRDVRQSFGLSAQVVVRLIAKVADAYKLDRKAKRAFQPLGAISHDARILRYFPDAGAVSIWTVEGRQVIPFSCGTHHHKLLQGRRGESDLVCRDGKWYLYTSCVVDEPTPAAVTDLIGVDLGIVNVASDSDGHIYTGAHLNGLRHRHRRLRGKLQAKGTKSAKRLLKKRRRQESRFARDVNHCISKSIVAEAQRTGRGVALEDLKGIRERVRAPRPQRATLHSWAFAQLGRFITYKGAIAGVPVVFVDPRNTSRECPDCGHINKANRTTRAQFRCTACGLAGPADTIAAMNIRVRGRAAVMRPNAGDPGGRAPAVRRAAETVLLAGDLANPRLWARGHDRCGEM